MTSSVFSLGAHSRFMFKLIEPSIKPKNMSFFKQFFCDRSNHLARYTRLTTGMDKTLKFTVSALDLSRKLTARFDPESSTLPGLTAAHTGFKDARAVISLGNVFQGVIPGIVGSVKLCNKLISDIRKEREGTSLNSSPLVYFPSSKTNQAYNQIALGKRQQARKLCENILSIVGAGAYVVTFGGIRPVMLANQYGHFCSSSQTQVLGLAADSLMCASHITGIGASICSLAFEKEAYKEAKISVVSSEIKEHYRALSRAHRSTLINTSVGITEKILDLACDILKLVPACARAVPGEVRAALGVLIGALGIYKVWRTS